MPHSTSAPAGLPELDAASRDHAAAVAQYLREQLQAAGGALPFDRFMELALYAPGLGYYVAGARKFGAEGDFVTAPELSPLFGRAMARQCGQVLAQLSSHGPADLLEFGAGSGTMAADLLLQLEADGLLPRHYFILELSAELQARQRDSLQRRAGHLLERVRWLTGLPASFRGVMLGNEVLDAMPVQRFRLTAEGVEEACVIPAGDGFAWQWRPAATAAPLEEAVTALRGDLPVGYVSEVNLRLAPWLAAVAASLTAGALLLVDYGYSAAEYYHPERDGGTLICHFRHRAHDDPLVLAGLQDITANVDFSAVARAGTAAGLRLAGYSTQAHFLIGCGLDGLLAEGGGDPAAYLDLVQGVKQLTLPSAMGERFKAIGFTKGLADLALCGFTARDLRDRL
jgi:SAM-dependent MidA family methyltransferase